MLCITVGYQTSGVHKLRKSLPLMPNIRKEGEIEREETMFPTPFPRLFWVLSSRTSDFLD